MSKKMIFLILAVLAVIIYGVSQDLKYRKVNNPTAMSDDSSDFLPNDNYMTDIQIKHVVTKSFTDKIANKEMVVEPYTREELEEYGLMVNEEVSVEISDNEIINMEPSQGAMLLDDLNVYEDAYDSYMDHANLELIQERAQVEGFNF